MYKKVHSDLFVQATVKGSEVKRGQILDIIEFQFYQCHHVVLGQTWKIVHGDLFVRPTVKGSEVKKGQFSNIVI